MTQPTLCMADNTLLSVSSIRLFCPCYTAAQAAALPHFAPLS